MKINRMYTAIILLGFVGSAWIGWQGHARFADIETQIFTEDTATNEQHDWGNIVIYTPEATTTTFGTKNMLTAMAEIKPGQEIHPPHQHTAEEFVYLIQGSGTWSINGELVPAKAGDVMYASPWDWHGLTNTSATPLRFFVVKWDNKGIRLPVKPE
jgi:mannose-6-phosphate isomerase-like protein (cupin superfamily)